MIFNIFIAILISLVPITLIWTLRYAISKNKISRSTTGFLSKRELASDYTIEMQQIIEKIKLLYLNRIISNIYVGNGYIRFEDYRRFHFKDLLMFPLTWNVYHIDFSSPHVLRYRGFLFAHRINLMNLEGINLFLSE